MCADPEVSIRRLEPNVEFLVIASDGVFEFMKSQTVVDMVRCPSLGFNRGRWRNGKRPQKEREPRERGGDGGMFGDRQPKGK